MHLQQGRTYFVNRTAKTKWGEYDMVVAFAIHEQKFGLVPLTYLTADSMDRESESDLSHPWWLSEGTTWAPRDKTQPENQTQTKGHEPNKENAAERTENAAERNPRFTHEFSL